MSNGYHTKDLMFRTFLSNVKSPIWVLIEPLPITFN